MRISRSTRTTAALEYAGGYARTLLHGGLAYGEHFIADLRWDQYDQIGWAMARTPDWPSDAANIMAARVDCPTATMIVDDLRLLEGRLVGSDWITPWPGVDPGSNPTCRTEDFLIASGTGQE
jgi:hypothetical protein